MTEIDASTVLSALVSSEANIIRKSNNTSTKIDAANTKADIALNKADTANNKADTALNKANAANTNVSKALSDLNAGKYLTEDTLSNAPSFEALQTQVNNSAVGTNLLLGTGISVSATGNNSSNETQNTYNLADSMTAYDLYQKYGSTFTLSYDWVANDTSGTYSGAMQQQWNQVPWEIGDSNTISSSNKSGHKSITFTLSSSSSNTATGFQFRLDNVPSTTTITISNMKLEKGSVATDWCPNPAENLTYQALNDFYMPTVKAYGAEGDGVTDDTVAIQKAIDANVNGAIAFPPGTYLINNTIKINQRCSLHFYGATIKAAKTMSAMFYTDSWNFEYSLNIISMIGDGASCLDLNNNASIGIRACGLILQTFSIKNLPDNAIGIKVDGISKMTNIMMMNSISTTGTVGIQFDATNCRLQHFVPVNIEKGIVVNQSSIYITDYHPWSVVMPMTNRSVGIQVNAAGVYLNDYYADTCFKGIEVNGPYVLIIINNLNAYWNTAFYNDQNSSPVPYLFYFNNFGKSYNGANILVSNSLLWNSANIKGQLGIWSNLTDNSGFGLSNVKISKNTENINGIATQFLA